MMKIKDYINQFPDKKITVMVNACNMDDVFPLNKDLLNCNIDDEFAVIKPYKDGEYGIIRMK